MKGMAAVSTVTRSEAQTKPGERSSGFVSLFDRKGAGIPAPSRYQARHSVEAHLLGSSPTQAAVDVNAQHSCEQCRQTWLHICECWSGKRAHSLPQSSQIRAHRPAVACAIGLRRAR